MNNKYIYVLTEAGETHELIAELDEPTINRLAALFFDQLEDPDDEDAPKSIQEVKQRIKDEVLNSPEHSAYFNVYQLSRQTLNKSIDTGYLWAEDQDFEVKPGAEIWELGDRIVMGCDMSYAIAPIGYFTKKIKKSGLWGEWIARKLK